jgi:exonuclease VII large subunit
MTNDQETPTSAMDDATKEEQFNRSRLQMAEAVAIAAAKVEFKPKEESTDEFIRRIREEKEEKKIRGVKRAAKTMIKKKMIKKMTTYFHSK